MGQKGGAETSDIQRLIEDSVKRFVAESPGNRLVDVDGSPIFEEPLVGFADGDDPIFGEYKRIIGPFHLTPREVLQAHVEGLANSQLQRVGVIAWVLPIARETCRSNSIMEVGPSLRWNHTRWRGEPFNDALKRHVTALLRELGYAAIVPGLTSSFKPVEREDGLASTWSERHAGYAAGLGTFGLSDGLITPKGIAMRCGSVVANVGFVASPRNYTDHMAYCPFAQDGSCGVCIDRCPAGAISVNGHDKKRCREYMEVDLTAWAASQGLAGYIGPYVGCGLCQTGVPCEAGIPPR